VNRVWNEQSDPLQEFLLIARSVMDCGTPRPNDSRLVLTNPMDTTGVSVNLDSDLNI
jgi:hypothetical protein